MTEFTIHLQNKFTIHLMSDSKLNFTTVIKTVTNPQPKIRNPKPEFSIPSNPSPYAYPFPIHFLQRLLSSMNRHSVLLPASFFLF